MGNCKPGHDGEYEDTEVYVEGVIEGEGFGKLWVTFHMDYISQKQADAILVSGTRNAIV